MVRHSRISVFLLMLLAALGAQAGDDEDARLPEEQESPTLRDPLPVLAPPTAPEPPVDFSTEVPPPPPLAAPPAP